MNNDFKEIIQTIFIVGLLVTLVVLVWAISADAQAPSGRIAVPPGDPSFPSIGFLPSGETVNTTAALGLTLVPGAVVGVVNGTTVAFFGPNGVSTANHLYASKTISASDQISTTSGIGVTGYGSFGSLAVTTEMAGNDLNLSGNMVVSGTTTLTQDLLGIQYKRNFYSGTIPSASQWTIEVLNWNDVYNLRLVIGAYNSSGYVSKEVWNLFAGWRRFIAMQEYNLGYDMVDVGWHVLTKDAGNDHVFTFSIKPGAFATPHGIELWLEGTLDNISSVPTIVMENLGGSFTVGVNYEPNVNDSVIYNQFNATNSTGLNPVNWYQNLERIRMQRLGTAALPIISVTNDTDTGIRWGGSNDLHVSAGGATVLSMTATTVYSPLPFVGGGFLSASSRDEKELSGQTTSEKMNEMFNRIANATYENWTYKVPKQYREDKTELDFTDDVEEIEGQKPRIIKSKRQKLREYKTTREHLLSNPGRNNPVPGIVFGETNYPPEIVDYFWNEEAKEWEPKIDLVRSVNYLLTLNSQMAKKIKALEARQP